MGNEPKCWDCGGRHDIDERMTPPPGGFRLECAACGAPLKFSEEAAPLRDTETAGTKVFAQAVGLLLPGAGR